jgi:hypothetical protein
MTILPLQAFGLGDIIFSMTLVNRIANGNPIVWGCLPAFVEGLNRAYPNVNFVDYTKLGIDYNCKEHKEIYHAEYGLCAILPIRWADAILKVGYTHWMRAKYDLYGMDYKDWKECAMWVRDKSKENELIAMHVNNAPILINGTFGSDCKLKSPVPAIKGAINMRVIDKYSLFDWVGVIQKAREIHTVNTSIIYLLDQLELTAKEVHIYPRSIASQTHKGVDYLINKHNYIYHG